MDTDSRQLVRKFCELCNWAHECWVTHKTLFDDNPNKELVNRNAPYFHEHLWHISLEYSYLQICKLHDSACFGRNNSYNLSISYIIEKLEWGEEKKRADELSQKLAYLYGRINPARNKVIAHNDLDILLKDEPVGAFTEGKDVEYFQYLQELVSLVYEKWVGGPFIFEDMNLGKANAREYLGCLEKGEEARARQLLEDLKRLESGSA